MNFMIVSLAILLIARRAKKSTSAVSPMSIFVPAHD
jgi:hypothetical protein